MANQIDAGLIVGASDLAESAFRLWSFIHKRSPRFTRDQALHVLQTLKPIDDEELKPFAKRLQTALELQRIRLPYTTALQAAARTLKGEDWQQVRQGELLYTLKLPSWQGEADEHLVDWHAAGQRLASVCERWMKEHSECRAFKIETTAVALVVWALTLGQAWGDGHAFPVAVINSLDGRDVWLSGVTVAIEVLRRRLEESRLALVDGFEVLSWCDRRARPWVSFSAPNASDARNAELTLMREDDPAMPGGFEIARGDELACWSQLELALEQRSGDATVDDHGGWVFDASRYVWCISTLEPGAYAPQLVSQQLGTVEASRLLRRYRMVKHIVGAAPKYRPGRKPLEYLGSPAETYRMDLNKLEVAFKRIGLSWSEYCVEVGEPHKQDDTVLSLSFLLPMLVTLGLEDPDSLFALPSRVELVRCDGDTLLRALLPRVDHVRYRLSTQVTSEVRMSVKHAVEELATTILMRLGIFQTEDPLPDLVYGSDGGELLAALDEMGLVAYVGVLPHFRKMPAADARLPHSYPYAFGHSLFLDIVGK